MRWVAAPQKKGSYNRLCVNYVRQTYCVGNFIFWKSVKKIRIGKLRHPSFAFISFDDVVISIMLITAIILQNVTPPYEPIPVVVRSKALIWGRLIAGVAGSNPAEGVDVSLSLSVV